VGRPVIDAAARAELGDAWRLKTGTISGFGRPRRRGHHRRRPRPAASVPSWSPGWTRATWPDPALAARALSTVDFLISLEVRRSAVTRRADVVFPVAPVAEKAAPSSTGRAGCDRSPGLRHHRHADARVLDALASEMGVEIGCADVTRSAASCGRCP
jgi:NADH-quinone oxidoreductase subunit G